MHVSIVIFYLYYLYCEYILYTEYSLRDCLIRSSFTLQSRGVVYLISNALYIGSNYWYKNDTKINSYLISNSFRK